MKKCPVCNKIKPLDGFRRSKTKPLGREGLCRDCKKEREAKYRKKHRDAIRSKQRLSYKQNASMIKKKRKVEYDPLKARARWMASKIPSQKCKFCDLLGERHHPNYNEPLRIVFVCKSHHKAIHDGTIKV